MSTNTMVNPLPQGPVPGPTHTAVDAVLFAIVFGLSLGLVLWIRNWCRERARNEPLVFPRTQLAITSLFIGIVVTIA
jgi:hypothetical protein